MKRETFSYYRSLLCGQSCIGCGQMDCKRGSCEGAIFSKARPGRVIHLQTFGSTALIKYLYGIKFCREIEMGDFTPIKKLVAVLGKK